MIPVKYFHSHKTSFCVSEILWRSLDCHNIEVNQATVRYGDIAGLNIDASAFVTVFLQGLLSAHR